MKAFILAIIFISMKYCTYSNCNENYFNLDDDYPDEIISEYKISKCIIYENSIDSNTIVSEVFFNEKGQTFQIIEYLYYKQDSFAIKHTFFYSEKYPKTVVEYYKTKNILYSESIISRDSDFNQTTKGFDFRDTLYTSIHTDEKIIHDFFQDNIVSLRYEYLKDECGIEKAIKIFNENLELTHFTIFTFDSLGRHSTSTKYNADSTIAGKLIYTYKNNFYEPVLEVIYKENFKIHELVRILDNKGLPIKIQEFDIKNNKTTLEEIIRHQNGLIKEIFITFKEGDEILSQKTFLYEYK